MTVYFLVEKEHHPNHTTVLAWSEKKELLIEILENLPKNEEHEIIDENTFFDRLTEAV